MTFYTEAIKSNILWQPKDHLINSDTFAEKICYFTLSEKSITDLKKRGTDDKVKKDTKDYYTRMQGMLPMWKLMLLSYTENHSEVFTIGKGVSDSFTVMSTGTNTIKIMLTGVLEMYVEQDYRLDFLYIYDNFFRGYKLEDNDVELQMVIENTIFNFKSNNLHYRQDPGMPDFARIQMSGIAYQYSVISDSTTSTQITNTTTAQPTYNNIGTISNLMSRT
jgi:hypothetical protein